MESLDIFRTVVREGGVVRAAQRLHRVQSNVTTRIKQLEQRLGASLFRRQGRSLTLTPAGQTLLMHADRLLKAADEVEQALRADMSTGTFRLGSMESTAGSRLPNMLSRFHLHAPGIVIELQTGTSGSLLRKLTTYELDAVLIGEPFTQPQGVNTVPVFDENLVLITHRHHPLVTHPSQLLSNTVLGFAQGCSYRRRLEEWFQLMDWEPQRVLEFASYQAIIACVAAGTGCAVVPASLLKALRAEQDVALHPLPEAIRQTRTHLAWLGQASALTAEILDTIRQPSETSALLPPARLSS